jgi:hypothetical protein
MIHFCAHKGYCDNILVYYGVKLFAFPPNHFLTAVRECLLTTKLMFLEPHQKSLSIFGGGESGSKILA